MMRETAAACGCARQRKTTAYGVCAMLSEPKTLYKLMNLYLLKQVSFPLTNAQLTDFFLEHEYTSYFNLQEILNELLEAGLIRTHSGHNLTRYEITREGEETLDFFGKNISPAIIDDMNRYLKENRFRVREESGVIADCYQADSQDYVVHMEIREGKSCLLDLNLTVPDLEQAEAMCSQWEEKNSQVYSFLMKTLTGND